MSRAALRDSPGFARNNWPQGESFQGGVCSRPPARSTENRRGFAACSGAVIGASTPPWPQAKKAPMPNGVDVRDLRGDLQAAGDIQSGDGGPPYSSQDGGGNPGVKPECGPVISVSAKTAVAAVTSPAATLRSATCIKVRVQSRQTGGLRGRPRLPASQQDDVKRWPPVSECRASRLRSFANMSHTRRIASRPYKPGHPQAHAMSTNLNAVNRAASLLGSNCWLAAAPCRAATAILLAAGRGKRFRAPLPGSRSAFSAGPRRSVACQPCSGSNSPHVWSLLLAGKTPARAQ